MLPIFTLLILLPLSAFFSAIQAALWMEHRQHAATVASISPTLPQTLPAVSALCLALHGANLIASYQIVQKFFTPLSALTISALALGALAYLALIEGLPKVLAYYRPQIFLRIWNPLWKNGSLFLSPVIKAVSYLPEKFSHLFWKNKAERVRSKEEVETLVRMRTSGNFLQESEQEMITEILALSKKTLKDCMIPRVDVFTLQENIDPQSLKKEMLKNRYSYIPLYQKQREDIVGILDVRAYIHSREEDFHPFVTPPHYVAETMKALDLLEEYQESGQLFHVVLDEHGGFEGVITIADLAEEIVGHTAGNADLERDITELGNGKLLVPGATRLAEISRRLGVDLPYPGINTIGGLAFTQLGTIPETYTRVDLPQVTLTIHRVRGKRIEEILIEKKAGASP